MRSFALAVLIACGGSSEPDKPPPAKFDAARLEAMLQLEVPGFTADLMPGIIEDHANRRYTGRVKDLPVDLAVVASYGVCDVPCAPATVETWRSKKPRELTPAQLTDAEIEISPTTVGGRPAVAVFARAFAKDAAFQRLTVAFNNGVNELRITATIWGPVPGIASKDDVRTKLSRAAFEAAVQPFIAKLEPYF